MRASILARSLRAGVTTETFMAAPLSPLRRASRRHPRCSVGGNDPATDDRHHAGLGGSGPQRVFWGQLPVRQPEVPHALGVIVPGERFNPITRPVAGYYRVGPGPHPEGQVGRTGGIAEEPDVDPAVGRTVERQVVAPVAVEVTGERPASRQGSCTGQTAQ